MKEENKGLELQAIPTKHQMFLHAILEHIEDESFNFDFLLAATTLFLWIKLLIMLELTETFGPLI